MLLPSNIKTGIKQGGVKSFSWMNPHSRSLYRENRQFIGMSKHNRAMSSNGIAGLFFLPIRTTMNGVKYCKMLNIKLEVHMVIYECIMFRQDIALSHRSKFSEWFS